MKLVFLSGSFVARGNEFSVLSLHLFGWLSFCLYFCLEDVLWQLLNKSTDFRNTWHSCPYLYQSFIIFKIDPHKNRRIVEKHVESKYWKLSTIFMGYNVKENFNRNLNIMLTCRNVLGHKGSKLYRSMKKRQKL